jgi:hypothetical protein
MPTVYNWRVYCNTDAQYETIWAEVEPTVCPVDSGHSIDGAKTVATEKVGDDTVEIADSQTDMFGNLVASTHLAEGNGLRIISHNFCDACTWWHMSTEHTAQASTTGDDLVFDLTGHTNVIDVRHKRITFEDNIDDTTVSPGAVTMTNILPTVYLDTGGGPVALAQSNEDAAAGDDRYTIDYPAGTVTFAVARGGSDAITADFRKSGSSIFCFKPPTGKKWIIEDAEIDLSEDLDMTAAVMTDTYGSHSTLTGGAIVSVQVKKYKTFHDFQAAARKFWGPIPANFGLTGGVASPKWTFQWEYSRADHVYNSANYLDLNVDPARLTPNREESSVEGDVELGGSFMTVTIYGKEAAESNGG